MPQLAPGGEQRDAWPNTARDDGGARGAERSDLGGAQARPRSNDNFAGTHVAADRAHVCTDRGGLANLHAVSSFDNALDRNDGVRAVGNDATSRDSHRLPDPDCSRSRSSRRNPP